MNSSSSHEEMTVIDTYTSKQAEEDGILVDITQINPTWRRGLFNYITTNLLSKGYVLEDTVSIASVIDLLNQALNIVKYKSNNFKEYDTFFSGSVELPSGDKQMIFMERNETGKFTIMLPEDR